jgi:hypothetical protein
MLAQSDPGAQSSSPSFPLQFSAGLPASSSEGSVAVSTTRLRAEKLLGNIRSLKVSRSRGVPHVRACVRAHVCAVPVFSWLRPYLHPVCSSRISSTVRVLFATPRCPQEELQVFSEENHGDDLTGAVKPQAAMLQQTLQSLTVIAKELGLAL